MSWQILTLGSVFFGVFRDFLTKKITQKITPLVAMVYFYIGSIIGATVISFLIFKLNPFSGGKEIILMQVFGIFFGLGVYFMFESMKLNFTKTQIFGSYRSLVGVILSFIFLGEATLFNPETRKGLFSLLGFVAFLISLYLSNQNSKNQEKNELNQKFLFFIVPHVLLIGSAMFLVKVFVKGVPPIVVLTNQYVGSLVVILFLVWFKKLSLFAPKKWVGIAFLNGGITAIALTLLYLALKFGPISLVTPVENLLRVLVSIPIGLFIFKEAKLFNKNEVWGIAIGLLGAVMLALP